MSVRARQSLILGWLIALSLAACAHTSAESDVAVRQYNKIQLLPVTVLPNGTINRSPERVQAHVVVDYGGNTAGKLETSYVNTAPMSSSTWSSIIEI